MIMQTTPAPSRSRLLGSLKNSFSASGMPTTPVPNQTSSVIPTQPIPVQDQTVIVAPDTTPDFQLSNDQKMDIFETVLNEVEVTSPTIDTVPQMQPAPSPILQVPTAPIDQATPVTPALPAVPPAPVVPQVVTPVTTPQADVAGVVQPVVPQPIVSADPSAQPVVVQTTHNVADQPATQATVSSNLNQTDASAQAADTATLSQVAVSIQPNAINSLNPPVPVSSTHKEAFGGTFTLEASGGTSGPVEIEPQKEISPEVESFIQKVEDQDQLPQEIVIADGSVTLAPVQYPAQPVLVLPITPEIEAEAEKKNTTFSVKWLKEWCHKIIKMFSGKVIYRQE